MIRQHGTRLDDDHYQKALLDSQKIWSSEAHQHAKTLSFEDHEATRGLATSQHDQHTTTEQEKKEREKLEQKHGKESMQQAEPRLAHLHLATEALDNGQKKGPKNRKSKFDQTSKGKKDLSKDPSKSRQDLQRWPPGDKEHQDLQGKPKLSPEEEAKKHAEALRNQHKRALRQKEKEDKKHEEWLQGRKERQIEEQKIREERQLHELQKKEKERGKRKAKTAYKKEAVRSRQKEEHAEEQERLRQEHAATEQLRLRKERQQRETEAQLTRDRAKKSKDPQAKPHDNLSGTRSRSPSLSKSGSHREPERPPSSQEAKTPSHREPSNDIGFINDSAELRPIEQSPEHKSTGDALHHNFRALQIHEGAYGPLSSPSHRQAQYTI